MKIKKGFVIFGVCLAVAGTFVASALPWRYSHKAHALVLVKDPSNIEEAIKMVNHLTNILNNEQMKLALQLLQMKKLDQNTLSALWNYAKTDKAFAEALAKGETGKWGGLLYKLDGMLSGTKSVPTTWQQGLGEVADILDDQRGIQHQFGAGRPAAVKIIVVGRRRPGLSGRPVGDHHAYPVRIPAHRKPPVFGYDPAVDFRCEVGGVFHDLPRALVTAGRAADDRCGGQQNDQQFPES